MFNKAQTCCPIVFYEVIIAVFQMKSSQIELETDKKTKNFPFFKIFYPFFVKFLTDFVDWNFLKGQQRTGYLSSSLSEEFIASFLMKTSQIVTGKDKNPKKFPILKDFMHFFQVFAGLHQVER